MEGGGRTQAPASVRLVRQHLGAAPALEMVVAAIANEPYPFVMAGRWGLPDGAAPDARVVVAGAAPSRLVAGTGGPADASAVDPFAAFDAVPTIQGDVPPGAIGGGLVGWLSYDLGRDVERSLGAQPFRPEPLSRAHLAWFDDVLRRDDLGTWWVEALVDAGDPAPRRTLDGATERWRGRLAEAGVARPEPAHLGPVRSRAGGTAHRAAIGETIERIHAGELFQANVCLRLEAELHGPAAGLVAPVLTETDPWFGAWIDAGAGQGIVSASPELFLRRRGREVVTGPIKGTAPRTEGGTDPETDPDAARLQQSSKDHAEHVMIVDLMRNDLGRVSDYGSIWHDEVPRLEPHAGVWHLVSQVGGQLHAGLGDHRLLRATFPPGSVTGAPKVQAMRVIAAVEGTGREVYTGAHGFSSPAAGLELAVTIRTIEFAGERAWIGAGGGIVADSDPSAELDEALGKAAALVRAAGGRLEPDADADAGSTPGLPGVPWMRSADRRPDPAAGLLETLRVDDGRALHLTGHLDRLSRSLHALGYPAAPLDLAVRIEALAMTAVAPARIRVLATRQATGLAVELQLVPIMATGIGTGATALAPAIVPGGIGPHKYLDRDLIDALTARLGATPLLLDADGSVLEAGWANLWWADGDHLITAPTDGRILPGVTRAALLARRDEASLAIQVATAGFDEIRELPLLLTSARGVSVARLASTPPHALQRAVELAAQLAPLVSDAS